MRHPSHSQTIANTHEVAIQLMQSFSNTENWIECCVCMHWCLAPRIYGCGGGDVAAVDKKCNIVWAFVGWLMLSLCFVFEWFGFCGSLVAYIRFLMLQNTFSYHITTTNMFSELVHLLVHFHCFTLFISFSHSVAQYFLIVVYICQTKSENF